MELKIPPLVQVILAAIIIWLVDRFIAVGQFEASWRVIIAVFCFTSGILFGVLGVSTFGKAKTTVNPEKPERASQIVSHGIYSWTRNPMYLGLTLVLIAWSLYLGTLIGFFVVILFVAYITKFQIIPEERILAEKFGEDYQVYQGTVRRWF